MPLDQKAILKQIDDVLMKCDPSSESLDVTKAVHTLFSAIRRLAPLDSAFASNAKLYEPYLTKTNSFGIPDRLEIAVGSLYGILQALRDDYEAGYMQSLVELVHADIFADFLEMAEYLLQQGYKDPAAVVTGSVLEAHLRKLCDKQDIDVVKADGTPKKTDTLNSELAGADIYSKLDQKSVTAWLDLRNKAAHGNYGEYTQEQVALMIQGVRDFASRYPA